MDDISIFTHHLHLAEALRTIGQALTAIGLTLNASKTECWINETTVPYAPSYDNIPRAKIPSILRSTLQSTPILHEPDAPPTQYAQDDAPALAKLVDHRRTLAQKIHRLHLEGLPAHVAQALWRTVTAGDATYTARTTGLPASIATHLDTITTDLLQTLYDLGLEHDDNKRVFNAMADGGLGFTSATYLKDAADVASLHQCAPPNPPTAQLPQP